MMITFILNFFKNSIRDLLRYCKYNWSLARIQSSNPSCKFYTGAVITNSEFGEYNVVFNNTNIMNSTIGSHTYIQKNSIIINAAIGKFCSIASKVTIGPGIHDTNGVSTHPAFYLKTAPLMKNYSNSDAFCVSKRTIIGNDVWIGENAVIIDGLTIGDGAIIGAGAVVVKNVEPYSIVGGVPAKFLKFRFNENVRDEILMSKWWDRDEKWLSANSRFFENPFTFNEKVANNNEVY